MKFLCLVHMDEAMLKAMPSGDLRALKRAALASDAQLEAAGHYVSSEALDYTSSARIVRRRDGKTLVSDGPFIETKEQLGGFILIDAQTIEQAIALAATIPMAESGSIEVRPIKELLP